MFKFNVIATYVDDDQDFFDIEMNEEDVKTEKTFLHTLFREETKLKSLNKYSICQICKNTEELLPFLFERNGKYYFTDEDPDVLNIRNKYLEIRNN
jgi:hypothetical protein